TSVATVKSHARTLDWKLNARNQAAARGTGSRSRRAHATAAPSTPYSGVARRPRRLVASAMPRARRGISS
ncbi:hypothetical protein WLV55_11010, partial [Bordetella bronchiseptica]